MKKQFNKDASAKDMATYLERHDAADCDEDGCEACGTLQECYFIECCRREYPEQAVAIIDAANAAPNDKDWARMQAVAKLLSIESPK